MNNLNPSRMLAARPRAGCFLVLFLLVLAGGATASAQVVTNSADSGPGTLRSAITNAASGAVITFDPSLSGATITVNNTLAINTNLTIDASALTNGIQIIGNGAARILNVAGGTTVVLTALNIIGGNDQTGLGGGGIYNAGFLTMNQCTLAGNNANNISTPAGGGAIFNPGTLTLNQCTLFGNHSDNDVDGFGNYNGGGGGAIFNSGNLTVNQCTLNGNSAISGDGGGIYNSGLPVVFNSIVAGNSANSGADIFSLGINNNINFAGANIVQNFSGPVSGPVPINAAPQLAALGNYGGPTLTMPPLPGSPAINACPNIANFTTDQRGVPRVPGGVITDIGSVNLAPPTVATLSATAAVNTNATLNATVNPNTLATTTWFQWGVTNNPYSSQTTPVAVGNGNTALAFSNQLTSLTPGIVYHCRVVATNTDGSANGNDVLFGSAPVVTLFGAASVTNECHTIFTDPGATNALGLHVAVTGLVNTNAPNVYQLTYTATNSLGIAGTAIRLVTVVDTTAPVITMLGNNPLTILTNTPFVDPGATALDACGGSFTVTATNNVNPAIPGSYTVTYSSTDSYNNTATAVRNVVVRTHLVFVTTTNDNGSGSLRQAVVNSISGDTINFATNLSGATILLTSGQLTLSNNLTIDASALTNGIQVNGNGTSRIFSVPNTNTIVVLTVLTIANGFDGGGGGGIVNEGTLTMSQCILTGNNVNSGSNGNAGGGGIFNDGTLTVNQCILTGNNVSSSSGISYGGGGIFNDGTLTVNQSTLTGNNANFINNSYNQGGGGGICNYGGTLTVNQSTLFGNHSDNDSRNPGHAGDYSGGGGIFNAGMLTVNQCTLTGNHSDNDVSPNDGGGGIFNGEDGEVLNIFNSIIAGNSTTNRFAADILNAASASLAGANIVQHSLGSISGPAALTNAPQLAALGNYGGPTLTMPPLPGSPAIDACTNGTSFTNNGVVLPAFTTDQRGFQRPLGLAPDIGAVEGIYTTNGPGQLTGMTRLGNGSTKFTFTNYTDTSYTVLASTNVALPLNTWTNLGLAVESPLGSGQFQFTDPQAATNMVRFYRVRSP